MKALVLKECNNLVYEDLPDSELRDDDVMVKVEACVINWDDLGRGPFCERRGLTA